LPPSWAMLTWTSRPPHASDASAPAAARCALTHSANVAVDAAADVAAWVAAWAAAWAADEPSTSPWDAPGAEEVTPGAEEVTPGAEEAPPEVAGRRGDTDVACVPGDADVACIPPTDLGVVCVLGRGCGARAHRGRSKRPQRAIEAAATPGSRGPERVRSRFARVRGISPISSPPFDGFVNFASVQCL